MMLIVYAAFCLGPKGFGDNLMDKHSHQLSKRGCGYPPKYLALKPVAGQP